MATTSRSQRILATSLVCVVVLLTLPFTTRAQTSQPQVLVTWQAPESYIPPGYHDKALPGWASPITASVTLISGGKPVDLRNHTIYWYTDDTLISGGQGIQAVSFVPAGGAPNLVALKVQIPNYPGGFIIHTIQIPVVQVKAVIEANHPSAQLQNSSLAIQGTPYFFAVTDPSSLSYSWSVNGTSPATAISPQTLDLNLGPMVPSGSTFATSLTIADPHAKISATDSINLTYSKPL